MTGIVIEPMTRRHLRQVVAIESVTYVRHWSRTVFEDELAQVRRGSRHYVVARSGRRVLGYAGIWLVDASSGAEAHITNIVVDGSERRRGIASALMRHLALEARRRGAVAWTLEVRASATPAHELYRRFGFAPAGVRKGYYEHGEDALVMWCHELGDDDYLERIGALTGVASGRAQ